MQAKTILVVGAGLMGRGIVQVAAEKGFEVFWNDIESEFVINGMQAVNSNLERSVAKGKMTSDDRQATLERIKVPVNLKEAAEVDLVIEAITEDFKLKKGLFKNLDEICNSDTIFASNTSSIPINSLASTTSRAEKVIGMHFFYPVPVMALVEITKGILTSNETYEKVKTTAEKMGKNTILANDYPGFLVNRILLPMLNEAAFCVMEGAKPQDVDKGMKLGCNFPMGPLELMDFSGIDTALAVMEIMYEGFGDPKFRPCPLLKNMVRAGLCGRKTGRGFYDYTKK